MENKNNKTSPFWDGLKAIGYALHEVEKTISTYIEGHEEEIKNLFYYIENYEGIHKGIWTAAAENGWFPNNFITGEFEQYVLDSQKKLDGYMVETLSQELSDIQESLVNNFPERKSIIDVAFELHNQRNYIASIPLFLSQTDGIFAQKIGSFLFTEKEKRIDCIQNLIEKSPEKAIILAPMLQNTQFGASIGKKSKELKSKAPNRNGILHGSRKHLDYGTKLNSLKCISLLSYVSEFLNEE